MLVGRSVLVGVVVLVVGCVSLFPERDIFSSAESIDFHVDDEKSFFGWSEEEPVTASNLRLKLEEWARSFQQPHRNVGWDDIAFDFIPLYIGSVMEGGSFNWTSPCFGSATMKASQLSSSGATLSASFANPTGCKEEVYLIATIEGLHFLVIDGATTKTFEWKNANMTNDQKQWIHNNGFYVLQFNGTVEFLLESVAASAELFLPADITKEVWEKVGERNVQFLREQAYYQLPERNITDVSLNESQINDGDFLGVLRLDGLDPMLAWAMGSHTGHTTIALRFDGELYICESTASSSYWPVNGIQKTPYKQWIAMAKEASYNVVHLPLRPEFREKFNSTAAREWFISNAEGLNYGYHNMLFGWVDLAEANYPSTLRSQSHEILIGIAERISSWIAPLLWTEALNKRINTSGLSIAAIVNTARSKGMSFTDIFSVAEQDSWQYTGGYSMVCDVLVCETWKAGGIFGNLADQIQCTEFTNWDTYSLNIFDTTTPRPQECVEADPSLPFCQILGKYRMDLPGYNTRPIFAGMAQRCPRGTPPTWDKPSGC
eukprot:m.18118 g.18118  ORF g.18118 m.18118 type:complete len:546 (+) comp4908_c0_seq1:45-1682(+)